MASEALNVILSMHAEQYKKEAREAATATSAIGKNAGTATTATERLQGGMAYLGSTAKLAVVGGVLAAGAAVGTFAKDSIRAATDLNESINAVQVVFGDAAEGVLAIGENSAQSFGLAQSEFNGFAVQFSNFAQKIADEDGRDIAAVIEEMTGRIADFASVMNLEVPEAAEKFRSGLAGETEPLRQFGIDVSAAAVNQKALALGLADTTSELTEGDKVLARYRLIMEQTDKTAGDFANTQGELANASRTFQAQWEDFSARFGEEFVPAATEAVSLGSNLLDILDSDINLGWTQRLSAFVQLFEGDQGLVAAYIDAKSAAFELSEEHQGLLEVTEDSIGATNRHRGAVEEGTEAQEEAAEAFEGTTLAVQDAAEALEAYDTAFRRLTDPVFRHIDDQHRLQDAYQAYNDVMADAEASTQDQETALFDLLAAQQEVNSSGAALPETMGRTEAAFLQLADQLGLTEDQTNDLREALEKIDGEEYRADITAFFKVGGNLNAYDAIVNGSGVQVGNAVFRAAGGPVAAGMPYVVGEAGPELFIPNQSGTIIPNNQMAAGSPAGGSTTNNLFVLSYDDFVRQAHRAGIDVGRLGWT